MIKKLEKYSEIVGDKVIVNIFKKVRKLYRKKVLNVNSTFIGGGVSEILNSMIPLMNNSGMSVDWQVIHGKPEFYNITKKIHNGLQGENIILTDEEKDFYVEMNAEFPSYYHINHDFVVIHDPQPLPIVEFVKQQQPWIWRCHIDISNPNKELWNFIKPFIFRYNIVIVSHESYIKKDLPVEQRIISPAIDPLTPKNKPISKQKINGIIKKFSIPTDKPIISQVSRLDKWKDPIGVLNIYKKVKSKIDCRLIYCCNIATDDPEGEKIYNQLYEEGHDLIEKGDILILTEENDLLVNTVLEISDVIVQKSIKEGFCLAITEALWKSKPVVASNVGGIPLQIQDGVSGYLVDPYDFDGFADRIVELLRNKKLGEEMGERGKEYVRQNFLTTRLMDNYLDLFLELNS